MPQTGPQTRPPPAALGAIGFGQLAQARLDDAEVLLTAGRFDGAVYLCGYSVEFALKARVCTMLGWATYLTDRDYASFKTHDLPVLLNLSGAAHLDAFGSTFSQHWSTVLGMWSSQMRYEPHGTMTSQNAKRMIEAVRNLMGAL